MELKRSDQVKKIYILCLLFAFLFLPVEAKAGSAQIQMSSKNPEVVKGDVFTVVCEVRADSEFLDVEFQIEYGAEYVHFIKGGSKVSGENGIITVASTGNEEAVESKVFALQFEALKKGDVVFQVKGTPVVVDAEGTALSSSSAPLIVTIQKKKRENVPSPIPEELPGGDTPPKPENSAEGESVSAPPKSENLPELPVVPDVEQQSPSPVPSPSPKPTKSRVGGEKSEVDGTVLIGVSAALGIMFFIGFLVVVKKVSRK